MSILAEILTLYTLAQWCTRVLSNRVRVKSESLNPRVRVESKSSNFSAARVRVQVRVLDPRVRVKSESSNLSETRVQVESRVLKSYLLHKNHFYCILFLSDMLFNSHKISYGRKQYQSPSLAFVVCKQFRPLSGCCISKTIFSTMLHEPVCQHDFLPRPAFGRENIPNYWSLAGRAGTIDAGLCSHVANCLFRVVTLVSTVSCLNQNECKSNTQL